MINKVKEITCDNRIKVILICILIGFSLVSVVQGARNAVELSQDFQYDAALALMEGYDPYDISLSGGDASQITSLNDYYAYYDSIDAPQKMEANQFPSLLMELFPYCKLPFMGARVAWMISNLLFTACIILLFRRTFYEQSDLFSFLLLMLLMLSGTPLRNQIGVGQHTLFAFCTFMAAVYIDRKWDKKSKGTGILITLALFLCYFKYTLTVPLTIYMFYRKRYKEVVCSVALHVLLTVAAAVRLGTDIPSMLIKPLKVSSALSAEGSIDISALLGGSPAAYVIAAVVCVILLAAALRTNEDCEKLLFANLILWSLVLTYHRTYDFFVIVGAAPALFETSRNEEYYCGRRAKQVLPIAKIMYGITIVSVFFVLRVFHESRASIIAVGAIYYVTLLLFSYLLFERVKGQKKKQNM